MLQRSEGDTMTSDKLKRLDPKEEASLLAPSLNLEADFSPYSPIPKCKDHSDQSRLHTLWELLAEEKEIQTEEDCR